MGVIQTQVKNDGTPIPENIPTWVQNTAPIHVSSFVDDVNYQTVAQVSVVSANLQNQINYHVATLNDSINTLSNDTAIQFANVNTQIIDVQSYLYANIGSVSNIINVNISNLYSYINQTQSDIYSNISYVSNSINVNINNCYNYINSVSNIVTVSVANINVNIKNCYSYIDTVANNLSANLNTNINNCYSYISNTNSILSGQVHVINSKLDNVVYYANISNIHLSSFHNDLPVANLTGYIQYSNISTIDVRSFSNTSNLVSLTDISDVLRENENGNVFVLSGNTITTDALEVKSGEILMADTYLRVTKNDAGMSIWEIGSLALDVGGALYDLGDALSKVFDFATSKLDPNLAKDLGQEIEDDISSGNTAITIDWSQIRNRPLGYTGTTLKKCGIQSDLYMGGSIYYDDSVVDISQNFYGSVNLNSTSSGVKMIDGQSQAAYFNLVQSGDVKASGNVKTDDLRSYTSGTPIYCFNDLNGQGNISSQLYISATKDISASGNTFTTNLVASSTISGNLLRASAITGVSGGKMNILTDSDITGNVRLFTNSTVYGVLTANSLSVSYDSNFAGNIQTDQNIVFGGNIFYNSQQQYFSQWTTGNAKSISYSSGNVNITSNLITNQLYINSSNIQQYILNTTQNSWIQSGSNVSTTSNVFINQELTANIIHVGNSIQIPAGYIMVDEIRTNEHELRLDGNLRLINDSYLIVDPAYLLVEGNIYLWGSVVAGNSLYSNGSCYISGNCEIVSDVKLTGNILSQDEFMVIVANSLSLIGNVSVSKNLTSGTLQASSTITPVSQGAYISWNRSSSPIGNGQTSFLNQLGLGTGGFEWVCYNSSNTLSSVPMYLYPNGNLVVDKLSANTTTVSGGINAGNQSFSSLVNATTSGINLRGTVNNATTGAHILAYTSQDTYPLMEYFHWQHDNQGIMFDVYWNGSNWASASNTTNYMIYKLSGLLQFQYTPAVAQGAVAYPSTSMCINAANVGIQTQYPAYPLDVNGTMRATNGIFTTSINLPNSSNFTGKTSQLNNDAGFLTSVGGTLYGAGNVVSLTGYIANNTSYNISCGTLTSGAHTSTSLTNTGGINMGGASGMYVVMGVNSPGNRQLWFYDSAAPYNSTTAATRINTGSTANVGYIGAVSTDGTTQMPMAVGDNIVIMNTLQLPNSYRFTGSYTELGSKPTIPTLTSQLTNDTGFLTSVGGTLYGAGNVVSLTGYVSNNTSYNLVVGSLNASGVLVGANATTNPATRLTYIISSPNDVIFSPTASATYLSRNLKITPGTSLGGMWNVGGAPTIYGGDLILTGGNLDDSGNNGSGPVNMVPGNVVIQSGIGYNGVGWEWSGTIVFQTGSGSGTSYTERMRVHSNGNVGIGTQSPTTTLDVNGIIKGTDYIFPLGTWLKSTDSKFRFYFGATGKTYYASASGEHEWRTSADGATTGMTLGVGGVLNSYGNAQFNNTKVGDPGFGWNYAAFGHASSFGTSGYALLSDNVGGTYLNSASGQPIYIRNANSTLLTIEASGSDYTFMRAGSGKNFVIGNYGLAGGSIAFYSSSTVINAPSITLTSTNALLPINIDGLLVGKVLGYTDRKGIRNGSIGATGTTYMISQNTAGNVFLESDQYITQRVGSVDVAQASSSGFTIPNPKFGVGSFTGLTALGGGSCARGTDSSHTNGAHHTNYGSADTYPISQQLNWTHDNINFTFDGYFDGSQWRNSHSTNPYQIRKFENKLNFMWGSNPTSTAGTTTSFSTRVCLGQYGVGINTTNLTSTIPAIEFFVDAQSDFKQCSTLYER